MMLIVIFDHELNVLMVRVREKILGKGLHDGLRPLIQLPSYIGDKGTWVCRESRFFGWWRFGTVWPTVTHWCEISFFTAIIRASFIMRDWGQEGRATCVCWKRIWNLCGSASHVWAITLFIWIDYYFFKFIFIRLSYQVKPFKPTINLNLLLLLRKHFYIRITGFGSILLYK